MPIHIPLALLVGFGCLGLGAATAADPPRRLPRDQLLVYRDPDGQPAPVKSPEDWAKRRAEIVRGMGAVMGQLPGDRKRCPLDPKTESEEDCGKFVRRLVTYASEPGSRVPAYLLIPKDVLQGKKKVPAILCLHGTDNVIGHGTVVGLGSRPNRAYAKELAERGYVTLAPNYPLLAKYQPDLKKLGWESGTLKAVWDNMRGLDLLESLPFVDGSKMGAIGHSLGGHNSVYTAVFDDRLKVIVSSCGLDSYLDYYGGDEKNWQPEKGWCQTRYMPKFADYRGRLGDIPFDFHEMIGALAPRHVLIIAPKRDSNFRADSVDRIAAAARPVFRLLGHEDRLRVEHPDCEHDFPPEMREAAYALFDKVFGRPPTPTLVPPVGTIDLNVGEWRAVELADGRKVTVKLLDLKETRDGLRKAVRRAEVTVEVAGEKASLVSANYRLPATVAGVQIDCPVTKGYRQNAAKGVAGEDPWGLEKDARLRLWPADSPLMNPGTFRYPARQRWFASGTHMANEPVHVDGGEDPRAKDIYYHYGLDIGGAEALVEVVAATDGLVVSSGKEILAGYDDTPAKPRYDVVYVLDARGWYYRYSHLHTIGAQIKPGAEVKMGQLIGLLGKEGGSGGWSHLHFDIFARQPSGKWGVVEGYAFLWEAYLREHKPKLLAVARPHHLASVGEKVTLDGSRSWSASGKIASYEWTFGDGKTATGASAERTYARPGVYSEVLKVTDGDGRIDYDFAVVNVLDKEHPEVLPPSIHAAYAPTFGVKAGDPVTFLVRTFRTTDGKETWDFGDGSPKVEVQSDGNVVKLAKDGYARTVHTYKKAGHYLATVERTDRRGYTAVAHLHVRVGVE